MRNPQRESWCAKVSENSPPETHTVISSALEDLFKGVYIFKKITQSQMLMLAYWLFASEKPAWGGRSSQTQAFKRSDLSSA